MPTRTLPPPVPARDMTTDVVVVGAGTGMAAALAAKELGLESVIVEKTPYVGGSTARSGGAFWIPATSLLAKQGLADSLERATSYLRAAVNDSSPEDRWLSFLRHGDATVRMLQRMTPLHFSWIKGYSDYHPELPGGAAIGRTCESKPFDLSALGAERARFRDPCLQAPLPMPITGADFKWINLMASKPLRGVPAAVRRLVQGVGGLAIGREYASGGQAFAAGLYAGVLKAGIPVWTEAPLVRLLTERERVTGVVIEQNGRKVTVHANKGVILAAGGFDHNIDWRRKFQSANIVEGLSLGSEGNTGDAIAIGQDIGADIALMDQAWWFPAIAPLDGQEAAQLLAERSLPGSFMVDQYGRRFVNESIDYMSFGQILLQREREGDPVTEMWLIFDQRYRNSYVLGGAILPRMPIPASWYRAGIIHRASNPTSLARAVGLPIDQLVDTYDRFNLMAAAGIDDDFSRGESAYDRYYGDPTVCPNPNLHPLRGDVYALKVVLSDLGTCGGLRADGHARVLRPNGSPIDGLFAVGNAAANAFGMTYPGAGATIGQGVVFGFAAARFAAGLHRQPEPTVAGGERP